MAVAVLVVLSAGASLRFVPGSPLRAHGRQPTGDSPAELPPLLLRPTTVALPDHGFLAWALLDRRTGDIAGSANLGERNTTASMIKIWLAADYLRRASAAGVEPPAARQRLLSVMIRDSDNDAATTMWAELGGAATIARLIAVCGLTDSRAAKRWSNTEVSARDAVRLGACIADGRAAGPQWTDWLLREMREVRGEGDFGIRAALPKDVAPRTAIKNGWVIRDDEGAWHVNCLAVGDGWVLSVLQRYPKRLGFAHGRTVCRTVAQQLLSTP